jgi:hypothetical protein
MPRSEGPHLFLARRSVDASRLLSCSRRFVGNLKDCIAEEKRTILGKEKKRTTSSHHDSPERGTKRWLFLVYRYSACYLPTYFHALYYRITNFLDSHFPAWRSCGARCVANLFCNLSVPDTMGRLPALALTTYNQKCANATYVASEPQGARPARALSSHSRINRADHVPK